MNLWDNVVDGDTSKTLFLVWGIIGLLLLLSMVALIILWVKDKSNKIVSLYILGTALVYFGVTGVWWIGLYQNSIVG